MRTFSNLYPKRLFKPFKLFFLLFAVSAFIACKKDDPFFPNPEHPIPPSAGYLEVKVTAIEGNGTFTVRVKGVEEKEVEANEIVRFGLRKGTYEVELLGLGDSYSVAGKNPVTVKIKPKKGTFLEFVVTKKQVTDQIVFLSNRTGFDEIFAMNADGLDVRQITNFSSASLPPSSPEVSPDGTQVVFARNRNLYKINIDGTNLTELTSFGGDLSDLRGDYYPSWSSDGAEIVFLRNRDGESDIVIAIIDSDGNNYTEVIEGFNIYDPKFSPDGTKVIFTRDFSPAPDGSLVYIVDRDGENSVELPLPSDMNYEPIFSPDGSKIAYVGGPAFANRQLFVANADGTGAVQLTFDATPKSSPFWSPDGSKIVFARAELGTSNIYTINADGTGLFQLTNTVALDRSPSWSVYPLPIHP